MTCGQRTFTIQEDGGATDPALEGGTRQAVVVHSIEGPRLCCSSAFGLISSARAQRGARTTTGGQSPSFYRPDQ